jgi:hypothetical protein
MRGQALERRRTVAVVVVVLPKNSGTNVMTGGVTSTITIGILRARGCEIKRKRERKRESVCVCVRRFHRKEVREKRVRDKE